MSGLAEPPLGRCEPSFSTEDRIKNHHQSKAFEEDYSYLRIAGHGSFATVYEAVCRRSGEKVACKSLLKEDNAGWRKEVFMCQSVQASERTKTSKVMRILDVYETEYEAFIVSDLCSGGDLLDWMTSQCDASRKVWFTELRSLIMVQNMLQAAEACHRAGLAHLDLKPENFCFRSPDPFSDLILVDFGSAEPFAFAPYAKDSSAYQKEMDDHVGEQELSRMIGTAKYMSPEVWGGRFSSRSDVWSIGVILYALLSNQLPFSIQEENDLFKDPSKSVLPFLESQMRQRFWAHVSDTSKKIVCWMLNPDPSVRASTTESLAAITALVECILERSRAEDIVGKKHSHAGSKNDELYSQTLAQAMHRFETSKHKSVPERAL